MAENKLVKQAQNGDMQALDELVALFYPAIFRYCCWHTPSRAAAEDATQTTFLHFVSSLPTYIHRGKLNAFLHQIAKNVCINEARVAQPTSLPADTAYTEAGFAASESDADLLALVKTLPDDLREVVLLRFGSQLKLREIAEVTHLPLRTVQSRLRSALAQLKKTLLEQGGINDE